jgi:SAM-dependent methyltransferase
MTLEADMNASGGGYDDGYSKCPCFWGTDPGSLIERLSTGIDSFDDLTVLDAGCGEGKNAAYLARRGANVLAIDVSSIALRNAQTLWPSTDGVTWEVADIREIQFPRATFDIVVAYGLFHCFESAAQIIKVISGLKAATRPNGIHVVCAFNDRDQDLSAHPGFNPCLLPHDIYLSLYRNWNISFHSDTDLFETHPHNRIPHRHSMTRMIIRNPE